MRKEVKLGMAIGGGLVALLVAYLLIAPPSNNKKGAQLAGGATNVVDVTQPGDLGAGETNTQANLTQPTVGSGRVTNDPAKLDVARSSDTTAAKQGDVWKDQLDKGRKPEVVKTTPETVGAEKTAAKSSEPTVTTGTEVASSGTRSEQPRLYFNPNEAWGGGLSTDGVGSARPVAKTTLLSAPTTRPSTKAGQHEVKSGETFSSIAMSVYGSAAYYPHLLRANPTVNPNNLKVGTIINVPAIEEVKATTSDATSGQTAHASVTEVKIDPSKQYKVQSGDSLYKISVKLYGKSTYVDKIYEKNKAAIGADPKKLKLGMILELPEAVGAASAKSAAEGLVSDAPVEGVVSDNQPK